MLPALVLFRPKGRDLQGRGAFLDTGFPNTFWSECYRVPCFFYIIRGAHTNSSFQQVMTSGAPRTLPQIRSASTVSRDYDTAKYPALFARALSVCP